MNLMHSTLYGEGKPMVILHGFLGMSDNWKTLGKRFAENGYEVHLVDQRNHGRSFWAEEFSYELMAEDLKVYLQESGISNPILLGHSMGGKTVMEFAATYPNLLRALIVVDISPRYYPPHHQYITDALNKLLLEKLDSRSKAEEILARHLHEPGVRQFLLKNLYWEEKGKLGFRANLGVLSENLHEIGAGISATGFYNGPTLFIAGDKSEYIAQEDGDIIHRHFPASEILTIPNAGHWVHAENPEAFYNACISFLARI